MVNMSYFIHVHTPRSGVDNPFSTIFYKQLFHFSQVLKSKKVSNDQNWAMRTKYQPMTPKWETTEKTNIHYKENIWLTE